MVPFKPTTIKDYNKNLLDKALSQLPRFIEELQQVQIYLSQYEATNSKDDKLKQIYHTLVESRIDLISSLPLGILKPRFFTTKDPIY